MNLMPSCLVPLGLGSWKLQFPVSLRTLQMLNTKFGKELPSISWEDVNGRRMTYNDKRHPITMYVYDVYHPTRSTSYLVCFDKNNSESGYTCHIPVAFRSRLCITGSRRGGWAGFESPLLEIWNLLLLQVMFRRGQTINGAHYGPTGESGPINVPL